MHLFIKSTWVFNKNASQLNLTSFSQGGSILFTCQYPMWSYPHMRIICPMYQNLWFFCSSFDNRISFILLLILTGHQKTSLYLLYPFSRNHLILFASVYSVKFRSRNRFTSTNIIWCYFGAIRNSENLNFLNACYVCYSQTLNWSHSERLLKTSKATVISADIRKINWTHFFNFYITYGIYLSSPNTSW